MTSLAAPLSAAELGVTAGYEGEYTSNVRRASDGSESDIIHRPLIEAIATHMGPATQLNLQYGAHRRMYQDDSFDSETVLEGSARVDWIPLPDRLSFFASNTRSEREIRTEFERTPANLQETSHTLAGATLRADLLSNHFSTLTYTYADVTTETTRTDSDRHSLQAAYVIPWTATDTFQIIGTGTDTDFDNPLAPDYQSVTGSVAYDRIGAQTVLGVRFGYTSIDRELGRDTVTGYVGGVDFTRQLGADSSLGIAYDRTFSDNSLRTSADAATRVDDIVVGDTDINEVYEQQTASLSYQTRLGVNDLLLSVTGTSQDYEAAIGRDSERVGSSMVLRRPIRSNLTGFVDAGYTHYDYSAEGRGDYDQYAAGMGFDWEATPRFNVGVSARYHERRLREDQALEGLQGDVDEWRVLVRLTYLVLGSPGMNRTL